jgi:hypothetical protein
MWSTTIQNRVGSGWWEDLSAVDRRALTEMLVDKIIIERHPSKIDKDGNRHYLIRAIPYQDPQQEAERLKAVQRLGSRSSPESEQQVGQSSQPSRRCYRLNGERAS